MTIRSYDIQSTRNNEFFVFSEVNSWKSCAGLCPRVAKGGQMPPVGHAEIQNRLKALGVSMFYIPAPYTDVVKKGTCVNIYNKTQILDTTLFDEGELNNGRNGNCVTWTL